MVQTPLDREQNASRIATLCLEIHMRRHPSKSTWIDPQRFVDKVDAGSPRKQLLLKAIAQHANPSGEAWPSTKTLARIIFASPKTVQRLLRELQHQSIIEIRQRFDG